MKTMKMRKPVAALYVAFGMINAALFGIVIWLGISIAWNAEAAISALAFVSSAILLMRAPFSRKNIGRKAVRMVRTLTISLLLFVGYLLMETLIAAGLEPVLATTSMIVGSTIALLGTMYAARQ